jgi:hypothetical protein
MKSIALGIFWIFLLIFSLISAVFAQQNYVFKVIASSNEKATPNRTQKENLKIGSKLQSNDQVIVSNKGYLALAHHQGGTVQISKAGSWSVKDLEANLAKNQKSVGKKYVDFVIGSVVKNGDVDIHKNPHKYQNVTGSVERSFPYNLVVNLPKSTNIFKDSYQINWHPLTNTKNYIIQIENEFDEVVKTWEVQDTTTTINLKDIPESQSLQIKILPKERKNDKNVQLGKYGLVFLSANAKKDIQTKFNTFQKDFKEEDLNTAHYKLLEGNFFEENNLLLDALESYRTAVKISNNEEVYDVTLKQFLIRKNIGNTENLKKISD